MAGNFHPLVGDQVINAKQRIDYVSATRTIYGYAAPGMAEDAAGWQVYEELLDSQGRPTETNFAGGTLDRIHKWSERLTLTYET